jgi:hypothetical protein
MTVILIPHHQDHRRRRTAPPSRFELNIDDFPELPSVITTPPFVANRTGVVTFPHDDQEEIREHLEGYMQPYTNSAIGVEINVATNVAVATVEEAPLPTFDHFMDLPVEIREMIWEIAMRGSVHLVKRANSKYARCLVDPVEIREFTRQGAKNNIERPNFLPPMCRLSKSTMLETIGVYVRNSTFMIASIHDNCLLDGFLQTVSRGFETIRSIHFAFFDCFPNGYPQNADLELAIKCTGLHTIKITFHLSRLQIWVLEGDYEDGLTGVPRPVDEVWAHYKMPRLLDCKNLQNIDIERKGRYVSHSVLASEQLGGRIKEEYSRKHGRDLQLIYSWARRIISSNTSEVW